MIVVYQNKEKRRARGDRKRSNIVTLRVRNQYAKLNYRAQV